MKSAKLKLPFSDIQYIINVFDEKGNVKIDLQKHVNGKLIPAKIEEFLFNSDYSAKQSKDCIVDAFYNYQEEIYIEPTADLFLFALEESTNLRNNNWTLI